MKLNTSLSVIAIIAIISFIIIIISVDLCRLFSFLGLKKNQRQKIELKNKVTNLPGKIDLRKNHGKDKKSYIRNIDTRVLNFEKNNQEVSKKVLKK